MLHRERQAPSYFTLIITTSRERHEPGTYYAATVDAIDVNNNRFPSLALQSQCSLPPLTSSKLNFTSRILRHRRQFLFVNDN
jgi:hypothetical protein